MNWTLTLRLLFASFFILILNLNAQEALQESRGALLYKEIAESKIPWDSHASSVKGRKIFSLELGQGDSTTIIFGAFHGNEYLSPKFVYAFAQHLYFSKDIKLNCRVIIVPVLNPDGLVANTRTNANGVDVNRNFPTSNWQPHANAPRNNPGPRPASEPETQFVIALLDTYKPQRIVSVHTPLKVNNYDGPGKKMAEQMAAENGYPVEADIGYPTPGSFGSYAGKEKGIPTVTLELPPSSTDFQEVWPGNFAALMTTLRY